MQKNSAIEEMILQLLQKASTSSETGGGLDQAQLKNILPKDTGD